MRIKVVENPSRRRRGRRQLTAAQKAAGFGGRSAMRRSSRRRRNPALATLAGAAVNPRRRRRRSRRYSRRRTYVRGYYRNPSLLGVDLGTVLWVTTGVIGSSLIPRMVISKVWPGMPTTGLTYHGVRAGSVLLAGYVIRRFLRSSKAASGIVIGGLAAIFYDLYRENLAPMLGLSGYGESGYVNALELNKVLSGGSGVRGYIRRPNRMAGFVDVPSEILAS